MAGSDQEVKGVCPVCGIRGERSSVGSYKMIISIDPHVLSHNFFQVYSCGQCHNQFPVRDY